MEFLRDGNFIFCCLINLFLVIFFNKDFLYVSFFVERCFIVVYIEYKYLFCIFTLIWNKVNLINVCWI